MFVSDFEGGLRFWVFGLGSSFSTHPSNHVVRCCSRENRKVYIVKS